MATETTQRDEGVAWKPLATASDGVEGSPSNYRATGSSIRSSTPEHGGHRLRVAGRCRSNRRG
ncbi:hypothetical protein PG996_013446 [Apiospora saccharicola]|uniref:Uncharacterized protein n=1 Tax=Apiospora saccharicola TaxID=335842 RepID=A0ABR1U5I0_9PEZI